MLQLIFIKPSNRISPESFDVTNTHAVACKRGWVWGVGKNSYMKGAGMLVVSLRGAHFGFWSHLGCSEQNVIILSRKGLS